MTMERTNETKERVEPTSEVEQATKPTSQEQESTSEPTPETFTKEELEKAKSAVQSARDSEIAAERRKHRQEIRNLEAKHEETRLASLEQSEKEKFGDTEPDLLKELHDLRRRVYATVSETSDVQAHGYAYMLGKKHGVDPEALENCASPEEMETKAKELTQKVEKDRIKQLEQELAEAKKAPQKIDSSVPSGAGISWRELSPEEKLRKGL